MDNTHPTIDSARRRFFWKAGAALSAPLAIVAASAPASETDDNATLKARLAMLEDANAIRDLNNTLLMHVNAGERDAVARLCVDPAQVGLDGVRALAADPQGGDDTLEITADGTSATAGLHYTAMIETAIEPACPLVEMARAQGGGVTKRTERGVLESSYVKRNGAWKIERLAFPA